MGAQARTAARKLAGLSSEQKVRILEAMAQEIEAQEAEILEANAKDMEAGAARGLSGAMLDRLKLDAKRIQGIAEGIRQVSKLTDPVGETIKSWKQPVGIEIRKVRVPIGVIGIIYESRPNVTSDAAVLCIKTGNAVILRGGSEAFHSNQALTKALQTGGAREGLPENSVQLIGSTSRDAIPLLARADKYLDLIIPRGGHALIEAVVEAARVPVIKHYHGVCHAYIHADADFAMAESVVVNGKCQRPGVCNALETVLVDEAVADTFLPVLAEALQKEKVELRGDAKTRQILGDQVLEATEEDWTTEYLDRILSLRVVPSMEEAIDHIEKYGSHHSDVIITRNAAAAEQFLNQVDSATVYWNASTRFTDGGEFGFGAEIGISTDKLHARGPMGLEELTTYKYVIQGEGQIRG